LIVKPDRAADEDEQMIGLSRASLRRWTQRPGCADKNLSIGLRRSAACRRAARSAAVHGENTGRDPQSRYSPAELPRRAFPRREHSPPAFRRAGASCAAKYPGNSIEKTSFAFAAIESTTGSTRAPPRSQ
jgi:hypothetical protein